MIGLKARGRRKLVSEFQAARSKRSAAEAAGTDPRVRLRGATGGLSLDRSRATTANLCSIYPFHADPGFGAEGVLMGTNATGGGSAFFYDPFSFYGTHLTSPNMLFSGTVGAGKSATVKAFLRRSIGLWGSKNRFLAIVDPKGEYRSFAEDLGLTYVKLYPGGEHRVNPMDVPVGSMSRDEVLMTRQQVATSMLGLVLGRPTSPLEEAVVGSAIEELSLLGHMFTLRDVAAAISDPAGSVVELSGQSKAEIVAQMGPVRFAFDKILNRTLRGMFDAETNIDVDLESGAGIVLDLSEVFENSEAFPLLMTVATVWLRAALRRYPERKSIQVVDEAWTAVVQNATYFQAALRLARHHGVATILIVHEAEALSSGGDDGAANTKIAKTLLDVIDTVVMLRQVPTEIAKVQALFRLSDEEAANLPQLPPGRALWRIAGRPSIVQTVLTDSEMALFQTDNAMSG